jgi:uncharacterized protein YbcI
MTIDQTKTQPPPPAGGPPLAAISTRIAAILRGRYGGGPMKVKTYARDDIIVVVMRGGGFTALEQTMMDSGESDSAVRIVDLRHEFQDWTATRYTEAIEELTGQKVLAFLSQAHLKPDITMETFFMGGALELSTLRQVPPFAVDALDTGHLSLR